MITICRSGKTVDRTLMDNNLLLYLEGVLHLQLERSGGIPGQLRGLFDRLDADMDDGIELDGQQIAAPDAAQRTRLVLAHALTAVAAGRTDFAHSLLTYVASRQPELRAVWANSVADEWRVDLDFR